MASLTTTTRSRRGTQPEFPINQDINKITKKKPSSGETKNDTNETTNNKLSTNENASKQEVKRDPIMSIREMKAFLEKSGVDRCRISQCLEKPELVALVKETQAINNKLKPHLQEQLAKTHSNMLKMVSKFNEDNMKEAKAAFPSCEVMCEDGWMSDKEAQASYKANLTLSIGVFYAKQGLSHEGFILIDTANGIESYKYPLDPAKARVIDFSKSRVSEDYKRLMLDEPHCFHVFVNDDDWKELFEQYQDIDRLAKDHGIELIFGPRPSMKDEVEEKANEDEDEDEDDYSENSDEDKTPKECRDDLLLKTVIIHHRYQELNK